MIDNRTAPYAAPLLLPILIGATLQHAGNGWVFSAENGDWEFPAFWTVMLVVQALLGDGAHAWRPSFLPDRRSALNRLWKAKRT